MKFLIYSKIDPTVRQRLAHFLGHSFVMTAPSPPFRCLRCPIFLLKIGCAETLSAAMLELPSGFASRLFLLLSSQNASPTLLLLRWLTPSAPNSKFGLLATGVARPPVRRPRSALVIKISKAHLLLFQHLSLLLVKFPFRFLYDLVS